MCCYKVSKQSLIQKATASDAESLLVRAGMHEEEAGLCPFAFGDIWLLAPIYIRKNGKYRKVTVRISIHHDDDFDKIDAGITDMLT